MRGACLYIRTLDAPPISGSVAVEFKFKYRECPYNTLWGRLLLICTVSSLSSGLLKF